MPLGEHCTLTSTVIGKGKLTCAPTARRFSLARKHGIPTWTNTATVTNISDFFFPEAAAVFLE